MRRFSAHGVRDRWTVHCDGCGHTRSPNSNRGVWLLTPDGDLCGVCVDAARAQLAREAGQPA